MDPDPIETAARWRVPPALPTVKLLGAAGFLAIGALLAGGDPVPLCLAALAAAGLAAWGLRDLLAPVRLTADPGGVTVISGYAGRRRLAWAEIEQITVDRRARLGLRTETLEIDTGETLHLLGRSDLGAQPDEVAAALDAMRSGAGR